MVLFELDPVNVNHVRCTHIHFINIDSDRLRVRIMQPKKIKEHFNYVMNF